MLAPTSLPIYVVVIMGVSGSGKSTVGMLLADRLGWGYQDADSFHPAANIEKMRGGTPLTDDDRMPWLAAIAARIDELCRGIGHEVISCSALKRKYRDVLIGGRRGVRLVYLKGGEGLIARRLAARQDHFMPTTLLRSQFEALDEPGPDEHPITVSVDAKPSEIASRIMAAMAAANA
jgi:gluconokinase